MSIEINKKIVLIIVDGFGIGEPGVGNAVTLAKSPNWDYLCNNYPNQSVFASGNHVGLPEGVMGNSEVGHFTIGTGRITFQSLEKINQSIKNKELEGKDVIKSIKSHLSANSGRLHLMGLLSDGKVHSDQAHLHYLIDIFQSSSKQIYIHGFTDGRDTPTDSGIMYVTELNNYIKKYDNVNLASIIGRYYVMDRDQKWDRTKIAYDCLTKRIGEKSDNIFHTIQERYDSNETDEFLKPIITDEYGSIQSNDVVLFFNFRPDRARQITQSLVYDVDFETTSLHNLYYVTMTSYDDSWDLPVIFNNEKVRNSIAEILSNNGIRQIHIAETEKYAHVTYFLNGGIEKPFDLEDRRLVPSPKISTYDLKPDMSTNEVVNETIVAIESGNYPFIVLNIACPDMVGHTGIIPATVSAVEAMDKAFGDIYRVCKQNDYVLAITSDHGNAEKMLDAGEVHTAHTTNKVPFLITDKGITLKNDGGLKNIAPTLLELMGIKIPSDMNGGSLLSK